LKEFEACIPATGNLTEEQKATYGNILFRYGWALIRSMKDIDRGVGMMMQADKLLVGNFDLKIKIAQILYQEK